MTITGAPIWIELSTSDMNLAQTFYGGLFGWQFDDTGSDFGGYRIITLNGQSVGGAMQIDPKTMPGVPNAWSVYLSTDDIDATTAKVKQHGGQVLVEPMQIGDQGSMAFYTDAVGAAVGAWQPAQRAGFEAHNIPGAASWFELMTAEYDRALDFYREVFGWQVHPMGPQGGQWQYSTLGEGDAAAAGVCDATAFVQNGQSYWRVYFNSTDTRQAANQVQEMGGKLLDGPEETPYGFIATVADDQGAGFQLRS